jgi:hypothetical protein
MVTEARTLFIFVGCHELRDSLGRRAHDEQELMEQLASSSGSPSVCAAAAWSM